MYGRGGTEITLPSQLVLPPWRIAWNDSKNQYETLKHNRARTERKQDITLGAVLTLICAVIAQMLFNLKR
jgi:hypothetical protein